MIDIPPLAAEQMAAVNGTTSSSFWDEKVAWMRQGGTIDGRIIARVDGRHYMFRPGRAGGGMLGFGGRIFRFRFADGRVEESNNVWSQGRIPLAYRQELTDNAEIVTPQYHSSFAPEPDVPMGEMEATMRNLSNHDHLTYAVDFTFDKQTIQDDDAYEVTTASELRHTAPLAESQVWSSEIATGPDRGRHVLAIDVDHRCRIIPTSTPGHFHLVIDKVMDWAELQEILVALANAGIVEQGYLDASVRRRAAHLRLPWVTKRGEEDAERAAFKRYEEKIRKEVEDSDGALVLRILQDGSPQAVPKPTPFDELFS